MRRGNFLTGIFRCVCSSAEVRPLFFSVRIPLPFNRYRKSRSSNGAFFPIVEIRNASQVEFLPFGRLLKQRGSFWGWGGLQVVFRRRLKAVFGRSRLEHATVKRADTLEWPEGLCDKDST